VEAADVVLRIGAVYTKVAEEQRLNPAWTDPWAGNTRAFEWDIELFQQKVH